MYAPAPHINVNTVCHSIDFCTQINNTENTMYRNLFVCKWQEGSNFFLILIQLTIWIEPFSIVLRYVEFIIFHCHCVADVPFIDSIHFQFVSVLFLVQTACVLYECVVWELNWFSFCQRWYVRIFFKLNDYISFRLSCVCTLCTVRIVCLSLFCLLK